RRRARVVGHAGAADGAPVARRRRMGLPPRERSCMTSVLSTKPRNHETTKHSLSESVLSWFRVFVVSCLTMPLLSATAAAQDSHLLIITGVGGRAEQTPPLTK